MVRSFISAVVAIAILLSISFYEQTLLKNTFDELKQTAVIVYDKIEVDGAVKEDVLSLQKLWIEKKKKLHVFIPHNDIKEMDLWIAEATTLVENGKKEDAISKIDVVIELCEQIPQMYSFMAQNVF